MVKIVSIARNLFAVAVLYPTMKPLQCNKS